MYLNLTLTYLALKDELLAFVDFFLLAKVLLIQTLREPNSSVVTRDCEHTLSGDHLVLCIDLYIDSLNGFGAGLLAAIVSNLVAF